MNMVVRVVRIRWYERASTRVCRHWVLEYTKYTMALWMVLGQLPMLAKVESFAYGDPKLETASRF